MRLYPEFDAFYFFKETVINELIIRLFSLKNRDTLCGRKFQSQLFLTELTCELLQAIWLDRKQQSATCIWPK